MKEKEKILTTDELVVLVNKRLDEEATARQNTNGELDRLAIQQYADLQAKITKHPGERFAFRIRGNHERTLAYGPRENATSSDGFEITYVGRIADQNPTLEELSENQMSHGETSIRFPSKSLYRSSQPLPKNFSKVEDLYLNYREHNAPSWNLQKLLDLMLPKELEERLRRRASGYYPAKETIFECFLAIGDTEFDFFLSVTDIGGYLTRAIEIIDL